jgi:hypothetical protein
MRINRICLHCGHFKPDLYLLKLYNYLREEYNVEACFITERKCITDFLYENKIISYTLECNFNDIDENEILSFLDSLKFKDFKEIIFTEIQFHGEHRAKEIQAKALKWLKSAIGIIPMMNDVDVFVDFAGDELGHNVFDVIAHATGKRIIKYRESLFPDRLIFTENDFSFWQFENLDVKSTPTDVNNYIDNFIKNYFDSKKVFWGSPKEKDFKFKINKYSILSNFTDIKKWRDAFNRLTRYINKKLVVKFYDNIEMIETNKNIFYFPLHYPMDSQLVFRGRPFLDQIDFALNLENFLPYNSQLVVKEHPHARGAVHRKEVTIF